MATAPPLATPNVLTWVKWMNIFVRLRSWIYKTPHYIFILEIQIKTLVWNIKMSRKVMFTTFYIPEIHKDLTFKDKLDNIPDLDFSEEDKEIYQEDNPIEGGVLYDAWTQNKSNKQLIDKVGINWKSVTELMNLYVW